MAKTSIKSRKNSKKSKKNHKRYSMKFRGGLGMMTPPGSPIKQQGTPNPFIDMGTPDFGITPATTASPETPTFFHDTSTEPTIHDSELNKSETEKSNSLPKRNLMEDFNDATDDMELESDVYGVKKKRKIKGGRRSRKSKKRSMRGGLRGWAELPIQFEQREFMRLPSEEQAHYSDKCFHIKNASTIMGDQKIMRIQEAQRTRIDAAARRNQEIARDPSAKIRQDEYDSLSQQEKQNWVASGAEGPQYDQTTIYRRRQPSDDLNLRARNTPNIHLDERQYAALDATTKALGWVIVSDYHPIGGKSSYYRRRVAADNELDQVNANIERMTAERDQILATVRTVKLGHFIDEASMPQFSIRTDRDAYVTLPKPVYNRYMVLSNLLEEETAKKSRLQSQLERL